MHVESRQVVGNQWSKVRGLHGCGVISDAGKELCGFLSTQQATVCNTWFRKKEIHRVAWQHPKSKQWSCIDYVIMRESDRRICSDITVKRCASVTQIINFCVLVWEWHGGVSRREQEWMRTRGMMCQGWWVPRVVITWALADRCSKSTLRKYWREPHLHGHRKEQWKRDGKWCVLAYLNQRMNCLVMRKADNQTGSWVSGWA